ncbi:Putative aspartic peptidase A1 family, aspartic peptidase domain superfamily [Septoria linicola]|uniref:Aspartic peptidase A1 family, aspartic peptidase domain superfamily n=1 Tax=Septoria linicola TaxID=215465 RepID=A0A9Q9AGH7_9PEZI|nr:Putative aspartic peptidase A1 family, aspartic peptidase domain superfamily [Septoria linicola]
MSSRLWAFGFLLSVHGLLELPIHNQVRDIGTGHKSLQRDAESNLKRQSLSETTFFSQPWSVGGKFYINITVGTPRQDQSVRLSTGNADSYFASPNSELCRSGRCRGGTYQRTASSTCTVVEASPGFNLTSQDGSVTSGPFVKDNIGIGGVFVEGVQFAIAEERISAIPVDTGVLGLGYNATEAATMAIYSNFPDMMVSSGLSASKLFSMFLGARDTLGSILFGGIDASKYTGELQTLDLIPAAWPYTLRNGSSSTAIRDYRTAITQAESESGGETTKLWAGGSDGIAPYTRSDASVPVALSSTAENLFLPSEYYDRYIIPNFPFLLENTTCSCDYANTDMRLWLTFGGKARISLETSKLLSPYIDTKTGEPLAYQNGTAMCILSIIRDEPKGQYAYLVGHAALSSMYVVFDQDNNQVSIAQAATNPPSESQIIEVEAGPGGVAKAIASASSLPSNTPSISTPASTPTPGSTSNTGAIAGGVVGGVAGLALIGAAVFLIVPRRKSRPMKVAGMRQYEVDQRS